MRPAIMKRSLTLDLLCLCSCKLMLLKQNSTCGYSVTLYQIKAGNYYKSGGMTEEVAVVCFTALRWNTLRSISCWLIGTMTYTAHSKRHSFLWSENL
jgi:hypothetical protein